MEAYCKRAVESKGYPHENCVRVKYILALMSAEPRDNVWADRMESDLRKLVDAAASEGFAPRDLECRLSWCIMEVVSTQGLIPKIPSLDQQEKMKIFETPKVFAPDIDDPNVTDVLMIYKRYCKSMGELFDGNGNLAPNFATVGTDC
jgi:hypothetical protein